MRMWLVEGSVFVVFFIKIYNLYLPSAVFIAQVLVEPSKQPKQIIQIEHNIVTNPGWSEVNQLAIYTEAWPRISTRGYPETNPGNGHSGTRTQDCRTARLQVQHADHSATLPIKSERRGPEATRFEDLLLEAQHVTVIRGPSSASNTSAPKPRGSGCRGLNPTSTYSW